MKIFKWIFIFLTPLILGCNSYPHLFEDTFNTSMFVTEEMQKKSEEEFRYNLNNENSSEEYKEWLAYSFGYSPEEDKYIVKVYNSELNVLNALITYKDFNRMVKTGPVQFWQDTGALIVEGYYDNNLKAGEWQFYHLKHGYLEKQGAFKNNLKVGKWVEYDEAGKIIKEIDYQDGNTQDREINTAYLGIESIFSDQYAGFRRKLTDCRLDETENTCTIKKIRKWQGKIKKHLFKNKIFRPIEAIVHFEIDKNGEVNLSLIRSVNEKVKAIILKEFQKEKFEFHPSDKEDNLFLKI